MKKVILLCYILLIVGTVTACYDNVSNDFDVDDEIALEMLKKDRIAEIDLISMFPSPEKVSVTKFNISANSDGYVSKVNLTYIIKGNKTQKNLVFRSEDVMFKTYESSSEELVTGLDATDLFEAFEEFASLGSIELSNAEILEYELLSSSIISMKAKPGDIVDSRVLKEEEEVSGVAFHSYIIPVSIDGYSKLFIKTFD